MSKFTICMVLGFLALTNSFSKPGIPSADIDGSTDHPKFKRYEGSFIVSSTYNKFNEFRFPLSKLEKVKGEKDSHNNWAYAPKEKLNQEGEYTRLVYLLPAERTPLEAIRNYKDEVTASKGKILYECKGDECGGSTDRSSGGGGGSMSLSMYLFPQDRITDKRNTNGSCATKGKIADQRYFVAKSNDDAIHFSVLAYSLKATHSCKPLNNRTVVVVDIVEGKNREQKMVAVNASEMAETISSTGKIALYGIYFDSNKDQVKLGSEPTLKEIATLLKNNKSLKLLVVGHTDNEGDFAFNMDLSKRRAQAVVSELVAKHGIAKNRLSPVGVSYASPVASNKSEEGKAKNRRVELVEN